MNNEYFNLKKNNKYSIIIIKSGLFYNVYGKDAIIINNMTNYKLFFYNDKICVSFPKESLNLILSRLRTLNISYIVIHKNNKEEFIGRDINYIKFYDKASSLREREILIEKILYKLKLLELNKLKDIEKLIERK